jgi:hypothetical protein
MFLDVYLKQVSARRKEYQPTMQSSANLQSLPTTHPALSTSNAMGFDELDELISWLLAQRRSGGAAVSTGFPPPIFKISKFEQEAAQRQRLLITRQQTATTCPVMTLILLWTPMNQMKTSSPLRSKSNIDFNSTTTRSIEISESAFLPPRDGLADVQVRVRSTMDLFGVDYKLCFSQQPAIIIHNVVRQAGNR